MMNMENDKTSGFFRFEDLRIYHKALGYVSWVHETTGLFPDSEKDGLSTPFIRSSQAIALNIAEGSSRNKSQFIYYLKMSKSAVRECVVYTQIAKNLNLLTETSEEISRNYLMELTKMIGALIASLQRSVMRSDEQEENEPET